MTYKVQLITQLMDYYIRKFDIDISKDDKIVNAFDRLCDCDVEKLQELIKHEFREANDDQYCGAQEEV